MITERSLEKVHRVLQAVYVAANAGAPKQFEIDRILKAGGADYGQLVTALAVVEAELHLCRE